MNERIERVRASELDTATMPTLDVRSRQGSQQIRGALRYDPKRLLAEEHLTLPIAHDSRVVVYADDEETAAHVAAHLQSQGYSRAALLAGGLDAYREAGLPLEDATQEQPIPGQEGAGIPRG
ncbi:MAG TPA: rhodanese-like domain-containing protein [Candidatus Baltobacteraceae bacterium]|nr:rhodanese-like domain-containing protein [Candidatus Baltobacteraceae bacterium]